MTQVAYCDQVLVAEVEALVATWDAYWAQVEQHDHECDCTVCMSKREEALAQRGNHALDDLWAYEREQSRRALHDMEDF